MKIRPNESGETFVDCFVCEEVELCTSIKKFDISEIFFDGCVPNFKKVAQIGPKKNMFLGNVLVNDTENIRLHESNGKMTFLFVEI